MNPFTALIDWLDENADYAPIGAFIGVGIALILCFTLGMWRISHRKCPNCPCLNLTFWHFYAILLV